MIVISKEDLTKYRRYEHTLRSLRVKYNVKAIEIYRCLWANDIKINTSGGNRKTKATSTKAFDLYKNPPPLSLDDYHKVINKTTTTKALARKYYVSIYSVQKWVRYYKSKELHDESIYNIT